MDGNQTQMLTLRIPRDLAHRLNMKAPTGERSAFVARAIERALDGESASFASGYRAGYDLGFKSMLDRSMIDRDCYLDALQLVHDGTDVASALRQAFEENPEMRAYRVKLGDLPGDAEEDKS